MKQIVFSCLLISLFLFSCKQKETNQVAENLKKQEQPDNNVEQKLIAANKQLMHAQDVQIDSYVVRHKWDMEKFENGLRIWEYKKGNGIHFASLDNVCLKYKLELINGTEVANSDKNGKLCFEIGKGQAVEGLELAVQLLSKGSKAKIILPSYLGYGFAGNEENIPKQAILIYEIEVL